MSNAQTIEQIRSNVKTTTDAGTISYPYIKPGTRRSIVVWATRTSGEGQEFPSAKQARGWLQS